MELTPNQNNIEASPFPALTEYAADLLEGMDFFASWRDFQANAEHSSGEIRIFVYLESTGDTAPSAAQINAYRYLKDNESEVTQALLAGLYHDYPQIREVYGGIEPEYLPEITKPAEFQHVIKPLNIHINTEAKDGCAYIGFECDCLWDEEHGLGIMMHGSEYIGCNDAEAAWNLDLAQS